jgi:hypothetical protein
MKRKNGVNTLLKLIKRPPHILQETKECLEGVLIIKKKDRLALRNKRCFYIKKK